MDLRQILGLSADATDADVIAAAEKQGVVTSIASQAAANSAAAAARRGTGGGHNNPPALPADAQKELDDFRNAAKAAKASEAGNNLVKGIHGIVEGKASRFMNTYLKDSDGNWVEKVTPEIMETARKEEPSWFDATVDPFTGKTVESKIKTVVESGFISGGSQEPKK